MSNIQKIIKRDGRKVVFELAKLVGVIVRAGVETGEFQKKEAKRLAEIVVALLEKAGNKIPTVEQVQDTVEQVLMAAGYYTTAKAYILYREKRGQERRVERQLGVKDDLDMSVNQLKVMENRYLLKDEEGKVVETPSELFARVAENLAKVETKKKRAKVEEDFYEVMSKLEFLPAGRTLNNAGTPQSQLANCFVLPVEDSMEGIFDAVKWMAMVHQKGGGCIAAGSKVVSSHSGLQDFEILYEQLGGRKAEKKCDTGWKINVGDKKIHTLSLNLRTGEYEKDEIVNIWRYRLPKERIYTIRAQGHLEVTTSDWHPFFVFEDGEIVEKRADEIGVGDLLISTNSTVSAKNKWMFEKYQYLNGRKVDEEIGWLVGYILGDGSFGRTITTSKKVGGSYVRLRMFDGTIETLEKASRILEKYTKEKSKIQKDPRGNTYYLSTTNQKIVPWLQKLIGIYGPKDSKLEIPLMLLKSPMSVVSAVLAGLLDSDGHVAKSRKRVDFATESPLLAEQIISLLSLMGIHSAMRERKPVKKNWHLMYEVKLDGPLNIELLDKQIFVYMAHYMKKSRLRKYADQELRGTAGLSSPLRWNQLSFYLEKAGAPIVSTAIHKSAVQVGKKKFWLHRLKWGGTISVIMMIRLLKELLTLSIWSVEERSELTKWLLAHESLRPVVGVSRAVKGGDFYDFTTKKHHNYLAGVHGLTAVHNTGFNFSNLRPRGDIVTKSTGGFATGPISFMKVFDIATRQVMQGGKKRGANMGILNIDHPDIMEFITAKQETGEISNFNISVGITDKFMKAVERDREWELKNPRDNKVVTTVRARSLFDQLVTLAWRTGDPGLIFLDPINKDNPLLDAYGLIDSTNPCGEQPLHPFDACNLGSVNLAVHVRENPKYQVLNSKQIQNNNDQIIKREIDWEKLKQTVRTGVRMLDNVIDVCKYPLPQITKTVRANRRIGLGVMGWADMLFQLRIAYDSKQGVKLAEKVAKYIQDASWEMSEELAKEKGEFPRWSESSFAKSDCKVRNVAITTIAPTGSISMLADASSGIEPVFALAYTKNVVEEAGLTYMNKYFRQELEVSSWADGDPEHKVRDRIVRDVVREGSLHQVSGVPDEAKQIYRTAHDISPEWHVRMQAAWQKYTDNAVSKTINFPNTASIEEVAEAYLSAWKLGCKGITVYRDGSIEGQILSVGGKNENKELRIKNQGRDQIIQSKIKTETLKERKSKSSQKHNNCPECGTKLVVEEGCSKCYGCGYSVCSG